MSIFKLILLLSFSTQCHTATVNMSVQLEQNVTLPCFLNSSSEMAWYRLSSDNITLLISGARGKLAKNYFVTYYNKDESHFGLEADSRLDSVSLAIAGVRESDLGLYYCALGVSAKTMRFGTAVRLTFADAEQRRSSESVGCRTLLVCACVVCGICCILCVCVLCYRQGSSKVSCISCVTENSNVKAAQVQYASLRFLRRSRAAAPAPVNVIYAAIANHTS
ncbi:uncharacterized protein LOC131525454 isoform X1 [Onychostoma macrolepis]|uniref:Immunoglobulin domain-containing protein n=1 Tax=Onychostoma macrolepis TaxID=369639 RepID=A0A7J6BYH4_9TELE|nr:uncharacterized protein LOC131525454 isoform X1 [Onychostoma macrolepis]KAF4100039.1 hypothetical protein G5714_018235 [Onychostoma macrolepis]